MIAFGTQFFGVAVAALFAVAALHYTYLAPMYAMAQGVAMVRMRTTSVALMLFVVNLVGYGVGPPLVGAISDWFTGAHLAARSEEHTSELQSLMRISYAVFCVKKKKEHESTPLTDDPLLCHILH